MILPVDGITGEIIEGIVHPSHVPLHPEAESTEIRGSRNHRPCGGFLGDRLCVGIPLVDHLVKTPEEIDRVEVLSAPMDIGDPFALLAGVVEVKHGRHGIDSQSVYMVFFEPEHGTADQKGPHFKPAVVENVAVPFRMVALLGVGMFKEIRPVEIGQPVFIGGEVGRDPVEDDSYSMFMEFVYEVHEVLGSPVSRGRSKISHGLVAP